MNWLCTCGFETPDPRQAFLHRDGSPQHHIGPVAKPKEAELTGIEKWELAA
jgi:hypothetical protein